MKLLLVGAASLTAITAAFANLGDTRADSAQRYGQPTFHRGANQEVYTRGNWWIDEWFNSMGYVVDITYTKRNGSISKKETDTVTLANIPSTTGWYPIKTNSDRTKSIAQIYLSNDNAYRYESGSYLLFGDKRSKPTLGGDPYRLSSRN